MTLLTHAMVSDSEDERKQKQNISLYPMYEKVVLMGTCLERLCGFLFKKGGVPRYAVIIDLFVHPSI